MVTLTQHGPERGVLTLPLHERIQSKENGIPIWMECSIYRSHLIHTITIREYFIELKTEHPMWLQMPRRMLRNKALQQCARLVFGIVMPESKISNLNEVLSKIEIHSYSENASKVKEILKEKLVSKSTHSR